MLLAPIGVQGILHPEAESATAAAAKEVDIPMILSTAATRSMEEVAEIHGDGHRWYQLYWYGPIFHLVDDDHPRAHRPLGHTATK